MHGSPLRLANLFEKQDEIEDMMQNLKLIQPKMIRWLTLFNCVTRITTICRSVISTLKSSKEAEAKKLLKSLFDNKFLAFLHFITDLSPDIKIVNNLFQQKSLSLTKSINIINSAKSSITRK
jgi:hypothetical protein